MVNKNYHNNLLPFSVFFQKKKGCKEVTMNSFIQFYNLSDKFGDENMIKATFINVEKQTTPRCLL